MYCSHAMDEPRSSTSFKKKLLVLGVGLAIALFAAELLVRTFLPHVRGSHQHPSSTWRDEFLTEERLARHHPKLGWTLQPNKETINQGWEFKHIIRTNSRGLRDDEVPYERQPNTRRIVLLGDSFGMGDGVERRYSFADQLERLLPNTEVVNLSVSGYGTDQELLAFGEEGKKYKPDIVLLAFVSANDIQNNISQQQYGLNKPYYELSNGKVVVRGVPVPEMPSGKDAGTDETPAAPLFPVHDFIDAKSALYALVFDRLSRIPPVRKRWEASGLLYPQVEAFYAGQVGILGREPSPQLAAAWELTLRLLDQWRKEVTEENSKALLVLIPSHLQVYPDLWKQVVKKYNLPADKFDTSYPNRRLKNFCAAYGIHVIDLLPEFRTAAQEGKTLYYKRNPHWNREGHLLAAETISREISRRGLLD